MNDNFKHHVDLGVFVISGLGIVWNQMPTIAACLAAVWSAIRIGEWIYKKVKKP